MKQFINKFSIIFSIKNIYGGIMNKTFKSSLIIFLLTITTSIAMADSGMWLPHQMKDLNLKKAGLKMNPNDLYKTDGTGLMSAVVHLGGGTGEFVSEQGLILTNHHVAFGAVQKASTPEHNYVKNGFYAKELKDEIPAPGYIADVLLHYEDITNEIEKKLNSKLPPLEKYKALEKIKKEILAKAESKGKDLRCQIKSMYSENQYYLFTFKRLKDIRIAYIPPKSIGNYGGDIDNWMWPRHTGDFSFLRAYVSKDNVGTSFSKDNIPYVPKSFFKLSLKGLNEGDFTFVMGYPGRTYRNMTYSEIKASKEGLEKRISLFKDAIDFLVKAGKDNEGITIKYAGLVKGLNNALKNYQGKLEGFEKINLLSKKKQQEQELLKKVNTSEVEKNLNEIANHIAKNKDFEEKASLAAGLAGRLGGSAMLSQGYLLYRLALERQKPDMEREQGYQNRDLPRLENAIKYSDRGFDFEVDKAFFKFALKKTSKKPESTWPDTIKNVLKGGEKSINSFVDNLYDNTVIKDTKTRLSLIKKTPEQLLKLNDSFINFAAKLEKELKIYREKAKAIAQEQRDLKKAYMKTVLQSTKGQIAPDANSSIRFTSGEVKGYYPKDAVYYLPFTTLTGVMEKETGKTPFIVPEHLKKLYKAKDFGKYEDKKRKDIVTCFLNTTNVTGGNSGSPILNANGEQVGIVFDMTYESVIGDYYIIPELQRTIHVDVRYVLFITDKFGHADRIIKEIKTVE